MRRRQLGDDGPPSNWLPQVKGRVERLVKRHLHRHQREPLCRALKLSSGTPSERIAAELERRRDLTAVVRLPELDRKTIVAFFREVAENEPFSEEALRDDPSDRLRMHLQSVLLEGKIALPHKLQAARERQKHAPDPAYESLKENVQITRVSRNQVLAYYTAKGMKGAAEELAAYLEKHLPGELARRLEEALQQSKACPMEHGVMGDILGVLAGKGRAYMLLGQMRTKHLQGLLMSMGHASTNMLRSDYKRAILELWADQEEDIGDASKMPVPALLQPSPMQHSAEQQTLQPSAANGQQEGAEPVVSRRINLAAISSADMPAAKRHRSSHTAAHQDIELQQRLQQVQESHVAHSSSAVDPQVQQQLEQQRSEEARQFIEGVLQECRERERSQHATQAISEQVLGSPEHVEQPTEEPTAHRGQQVQEGLQLFALEGSLPQQQALQSQGRRQQSPEREQQPAANVQQPAADVQQPARSESAAAEPGVDETQAVQHPAASHEGASPSGASSPRAALPPKRRRKVCFADLEGVSEVRDPSSHQLGGAEGASGAQEGAQEGAVTEVPPVTSHPAMVSSANRDRQPIAVGETCANIKAFDSIAKQGGQAMLDQMRGLQVNMPAHKHTVLRLEEEEIWVKLRPGVRRFLQRLHEIGFQLWFYSNMSLIHAKAIVALLDPTGTLVGDRLIAQGGLTTDRTKCFTERLEGKEDISLVLDDQPKYWPHNQDSLIPIGSYFWGPFARSMPDWISVTRDESADFGALAILGEVFSRVYARMVCAGESCGQQGESSAQGAQGAVVDARCALKQELHQVLRGGTIFFDGLGADDGLEGLQQTASLFGAACSSIGYTHIVGLHFTARVSVASEPKAQHLFAILLYHYVAMLHGLKGSLLASSIH
ncbi:TPA: hypothetical protein ACH3X2_000892 [Trebouxia sp. C0005]